MNNDVNIEKSNEISGLQLFAELVTELSSSTKTNDKLQSLVDYFAIAPDADKVWVIALFSGTKAKACS
jgi:DNA ligase-1